MGQQPGDAITYCGMSLENFVPFRSRVAASSSTLPFFQHINLETQKNSQRKEQKKYEVYKKFI